jgi:hypothetical protein
LPVCRIAGCSRPCTKPLGFNVSVVSIVSITKCPGLWSNVSLHKWRVVRLNTNISKGSPCCSPGLPFAKWTCLSQSKYRRLVCNVRMTWM